MSEKFKEKYRNESTRLQNWDYGSNVAYFITICTKDRKYYFDEIENDKMQISPAGAIAYVLWYEIKNHANNIELDEFVVMPNHVHGIIIIDNPLVVVGAGHDVVGGHVGTGHALFLQQPSSSQPLSPTPQKTIGQQRF